MKNSGKPKKITRIIALTLTVALCIAASLPAMAEDSVFAPTPAYAFQDHNVGAGDRVDNVLSLLTLEEKIALNGGSGTVARLGLNSIRGGGGEALHGIAYAQATVFPSPLGLSQTWDFDLLYRMGDAIAAESLANNGGPSRLAPVLDLLRDPRYGRAYETLGEDGFLTGSLGTAITTGMNKRTSEGYQQFMPNLKHPLGYNNEINRLWTNSVLTKRNTYEYYVRAFKYPISGGGAKSFMNSYPLINGKPMSVQPLQYDMLFDWTPDYDGTGHYEFRTVNDYGSGSSMFVHSQRYFDDSPLGRALGVAQGTKNGQMSWSFRSYGSQTGPLYDALARGMVSEHDFEENARRAVAMQLRMGDLDQLELQSPYIKPGAQTSAVRTDLMKENRKLAFETSQEQIVMLKNDGVLPLKADTKDVVLLGPLADQILNDHYTGGRYYSLSMLDALQNKLGKSNVSFNRAIDTIALKAPNGKYLVSGQNPTWRTAGSSNAADTAILANSDAAAATMADTALLFERHDYGSTYNLLRTPINSQYVQVTSNTNTAHRLTMINNTSSPGEANKVTGQTQYVNYQTFRFVPTDDGKWGLYNLIAGNGSNGGVGKAYDADDEDTNNGTYLKLDAETGRLVADLSTIGPYRNENHIDGPSITQSKVDANGSDEVIDGLKAESKFEIQSVQSSEQAIDAAVAAGGESAPIILVLGYEPHMNAREAIDLYHTGLSDQQMRIINHTTKTLGRDVILVIKTGSPMTIDSTVQNNPKIRAILEIGHSGQEEGSALVSVMFKDGYKAPKAGFAPVRTGYNFGSAVPAPFEEYPGYYATADDDYVYIPAASPAGRLSATWYNKISDMKGASEDHPPQSYSWPAYNEASNDNLSNMDGTINTGLMTYDIIKGERTYQYFSGKPLYAFGYGLTYTTFKYKNVKVSPIADGKFTVSGIVENTGGAASDEVVQIYSSFTGEASRIKQANKRLIAFERLHDIAPGAEVPFSFEINLSDKLGVYDVETGKLIAEPGSYLICAAGSSDAEAAEGSSAVLAVSAENGGTPAAARDICKLTYAEDFDDYSDVGGRMDDIELISASAEYRSDTAVQFRKNGASLVFKGVALKGAASKLTALVGSDRAGAISVYALPAGANPAGLSSATPVATLALSDTRPVQGLPTGLGIGPVGVNPGTVQGQTYKDAYVKPSWVKASADLSLPAGNYDIYFVTQNRGAALDWFKFGAAADTTEAIAIAQLYSLSSIRSKGGELALEAKLTPVTSMDAVTWSITDLSGEPTALATVTAAGTVKASGTANGTVRVTASSGGKTAVMDILITNQLDSNKVVISGSAKTVEYLSLRTGAAFGANDSIIRFKGTNQQTAVFTELFSENANSYYLPNVYLTVPSSEIDWKVTATDGGPTALAEISEAGLLTATGAGDGEVKVTATLKNNADIFAERVILLQNQGTKDAFKMLQAENFDTGAGLASPTSATTFGTNGNEMGLYANIAAGNALLFKNVDFGAGADGIYLRLASAAGSQVSVFIDGKNAEEGGTQIGTVAVSATDNVTYATYGADISQVSGVHDLYLTFSGALRLNWLQFTPSGLSISTKVTKIVAGYAANIPADILIPEGGTGGKLELLAPDGTVLHSADVSASGSYQFRLEAPQAVAGQFKLRLGGSAAVVECVAAPENLWAPVATVIDGQIKVTFASNVSFNEAKKGAKVGEDIVDAAKISVSDKVVTIDRGAAAGQQIQLSGVKYADLFPSYSFTFSLKV